jgi:hypothetical protein
VSYRGEYRKLERLGIGEAIFVAKPAGKTIQQHAVTMGNATTHFGRTRDRKFSCRSAQTGVWVTRIAPAEVKTRPRVVDEFEDLM